MSLMWLLPSHLSVRCELSVERQTQSLLLGGDVRMTNARRDYPHQHLSVARRFQRDFPEFEGRVFTVGDRSGGVHRCTRIDLSKGLGCLSQRPLVCIGTDNKP